MTATLVTGGTGYLGSLILARLLVEEETTFVLPVRRPIDRDELLRPIAIEMQFAGYELLSTHRDRVRVVPLPPAESMSGLDGVARELGIDQVIHAAGCLDYFDQEALRAVNVDLTAALLGRARAWGCRRFTYLSTAFSSGYLDGVTREEPHRGDDFDDPTEYTTTKREAELLVVESGLPYLIVRPSIVIGDSADGHYTGKRYGLYQLWNGMERLLFDVWRPSFLAVGPRVETHFLHQDAFQDMFAAAWRWLPDGSIFHAVSPGSPTLRELWELWLREVLRPARVEYYPSVAAMPVREMDRRQRSLLALASVNLEIATHPWRFEMANLERLRLHGLTYAATTVESVTTCQRAFIGESDAFRGFRERCEGQFVDQPEIVERGPRVQLASGAG